MAKSVLDLYELYNLVVARGGLVDVINKKLWQEIIKGLHLPSSITSAAFTLRTQYRKYLYDYECYKENLSTPSELQTAIDGNRREGRRSSYGTYSGGGENIMQRNQHTQNSLALHPQMPLPLVSSGSQHHMQSLNGNAAHAPLSHHPQHPQGILGQPPNPGPVPGMVPGSDLIEYFKQLNKDLNNVCMPSPLPMHRQGNGSPRSSTPPRESAGFSAMEMLRLSHPWNMYNSTIYPGVSHQQPLSPQKSHSPLQTANSPEPQREALDLGLRSPVCSSPVIQSPQPPSGSNVQVKRDRQLTSTLRSNSAKRAPMSDDENQTPKRKSAAVEIGLGQRIIISTQEDVENGANSVAVSIDLNGVTYEGVLFPQNQDSNATRAASTTPNNNTKT